VTSSDRDKVVATLAALLHQTAEDHHVAYKSTDGVDPDWSIWYAGRLLDQGIEKLLDANLLKSDLIHLLVGADKSINALAPGAHWEPWYADYLVTKYLR
jgi:hypothetical protein